MGEPGKLDAGTRSHQGNGAWGHARIHQCGSSATTTIFCFGTQGAWWFSAETICSFQAAILQTLSTILSGERVEGGQRRVAVAVPNTAVCTNESLGSAWFLLLNFIRDLSNFTESLERCITLPYQVTLVGFLLCTIRM